MKEQTIIKKNVECSLLNAILKGVRKKLFSKWKKEEFLLLEQHAWEVTCLTEVM